MSETPEETPIEPQEPTRAEDRKPGVPPASTDDPGGRDAEVDEQVEETFPASDPPANY